jgi:hypothetical protein
LYGLLRFSSSEKIMMVPLGSLSAHRKMCIPEEILAKGTFCCHCHHLIVILTIIIILVIIVIITTIIRAQLGGRNKATRLIDSGLRMPSILVYDQCIKQAEGSCIQERDEWTRVGSTGISWAQTKGAKCSAM